MPKNVGQQIYIGMEVDKRLMDDREKMGTGGPRPPVSGSKLEELQDRQHVDTWLKWAVGCCPMLITDAVLAMKGADKARYGVEVRKMYLAAVEVQQKSANTAQSLSVTQFFNRMSRAVKSYQTAFQDKQSGIEFRRVQERHDEQQRVVERDPRRNVCSRRSV